MTIAHFKSRKLKKLYGGDRSAVGAKELKKIERILSVLDVATQPDDLDLPGYRLHALTGDLKGHYAVSVSGNYRITFRFENGEPRDVNLVDYH